MWARRPLQARCVGSAVRRAGCECNSPGCEIGPELYELKQKEGSGTLCGGMLARTHVQRGVPLWQECSLSLSLPLPLPWFEQPGSEDSGGR